MPRTISRLANSCIRGSSRQPPPSPYATKYADDGAKKYGAILADPPWTFAHMREGRNRSELRARNGDIHLKTITTVLSEERYLRHSDRLIGCLSHGQLRCCFCGLSGLRDLDPKESRLIERLGEFDVQDESVSYVLGKNLQESDVPRWAWDHRTLNRILLAHQLARCPGEQGRPPGHHGDPPRALPQPDEAMGAERLVDRSRTWRFLRGTHIRIGIRQ